MKVIHRVTFSIKRHPKVLKKLHKLGIKPWGIEDKVVPYLRFFDIAENNTCWPEANKIIQEYKIPTMTRTEFTEDEILSAERVWIKPEYVFGYPMTHLNGRWRNISFNADLECQMCGVGREQIALIHLEKEPELKDNNFMAINWTFDYFARPEVFEVFNKERIKDFEAMDVICHKLKKPLKKIKQLKIIAELNPAVEDDNLVKDKTTCGHIKYNVLTKGMMRFSSDAFEKNPDLVRTYEWFGSGHMALQLVLASSKFVKVYIENNWKGLNLAPIELV
ncbi:MAG: hypothetical protein ACYSUK_05720 [Planctomycetota bacterium]|jgi:hypothetical protein